MIRCSVMLSAAALLTSLSLSVPTAFAAGAANDHTVLVLAATAPGGTSSPIVVEIVAMGYDVELVSDAVWGAKTTADFETYRAIVLGDPDCVTGTQPVAAAEANTSVWGPAIDGNVLVVGTDAIYHMSEQVGGAQLVRSGLAYVLSAPKTEGKTGAYIALSCYFNESGDDNTVVVLRYFGSFIVNQNTTCHDNIHITAPAHPAMTGLTDATLSNWNCSIHALFTTWPGSFTPLAIANGLGTGYTGPDGSVGTPYIFARNAVTTTNCPTMPTITIGSVSPSTIWPPNNKMVAITVDATVTGSMVNVTRTITVNEVPKESKTPVWENGSDVFHFKLRASRNGNNKAGRIYTITYTGTDACGQRVIATTTVTVPHDQRGGSLK